MRRHRKFHRRWITAYKTFFSKHINVKKRKSCCYCVRLFSFLSTSLKCNFLIELMVLHDRYSSMISESYLSMCRDPIKERLNFLNQQLLQMENDNVAKSVESERRSYWFFESFIFDHVFKEEAQGWHPNGPAGSSSEEDDFSSSFETCEDWATDTRRFPVPHWSGENPAA